MVYHRDQRCNYPFILYDYLLLRLTLFYPTGAFLSALSSNFSDIRRVEDFFCNNMREAPNKPIGTTLRSTMVEDVIQNLVRIFQISM
jgi:hypothetical protein